MGATTLSAEPRASTLISGKMNGVMTVPTCRMLVSSSRPIPPNAPTYMPGLSETSAAEETLASNRLVAAEKASLVIKFVPHLVPNDCLHKSFSEHVHHKQL